MSSDDLMGKTIKSAVISVEDQAIYLMADKQQIFGCSVRPENKAMIGKIEGADYLAQSTIVAVLPKPVVKHEVKRNEEVKQFCSRQYEILTDAGSCRITVVLDGWERHGGLCIAFAPHVGYPPDDAKRLEDTDVA